MNQPWTRYLPTFLRGKLEGRAYLQNVVSNTGWLFLDRIIRLGVGLLVSVWVARYLGPAQLGLLDYSLAFVTLFSALASLGLDGIVVRELVREPERRDEILASAFAMKLIAGAVTFALVVSAITLLRRGDPQVQLLVGIIAVGMIFTSLDVIDFWFQSQVQSKYSVYARNAAFLAIAVVKIVLLLGGAPLIAFALAALAETVMASAGLLLVFRRNGYWLSLRKINLSRCTRLLQDSWPVIFTGLSVMLFMRIDQVMLGDMVGNDAVGIYSAAVRLSEVWHFLPMAIVSSVFPFVIQARSGDPELYHRRLAQMFSLMTVMALAVAIPMTFFSGVLVGFVYGAAYSAAGPVLALHIWAAWFVFLGIAQDPWNVAENLMRLAMVRTALGALLNIVLNLILIPHFSVIGAAAATVVAQLVSCVLLNSFHKKTREIFFLQAKSLFFNI